MKDKAFVTLTGLFFLIFFGGVIAVALQGPTAGLFIRASNVNPSALKSFAVVFPQIGIAGDENSSKPPTKIKVSVYIRDVNGTVLPNRAVKLSANTPSVIISPSDTQTTNNIGQAQFFISAKTAGKIQLSVTDISSSTTVVNIPTVEFTQ